MKFSTALVDSDILAYRVGFTTEDVSESLAAWRMDEFINKIVTSGVDANEYKYFLTGDGNYRISHAVTHPYKGNRKQPKPKHLKFLRRHLVEEYSAEVIHGEEADDALGYNQTETSVICSLDKDLNMIPGWHFNFVSWETYYINEYLAIKNFWTQMLVGDVADNIKCIRGLGPKKVEKLYAHNPTLEEMQCIVGLQYAIHEDNPEDRLIENGRLLWIKQKKDESLWCIK